MRRAALAAALVGVAAAGCGSGDEASADRVAVSRYIERINAVQRDAAPAFERANEAYVAFSKDELNGRRAVDALRAAETTIAGARDRVEAVPAPAAAAGLRTKVVDVMTRNITLARQTRLLASYERGSRTVTERLGRLDRALRRDLRRRGTPTGQARALDRFTDGVAQARASLVALDVPAVLRPAHDDQLRRLRRIRSVADRLEGALLDRDAKRVAVLVRAFRRAGATEVREGLARRAFADYQRRFQELNSANAAVQRASADLERSLD